MVENDRTAIHVDLFSGSPVISIPVPVPDCRGCLPDLTLKYMAGGKNGDFGLGFALNLASIHRDTMHGYPLYDDTDTFVLNGTQKLILRSDTEQGLEDSAGDYYVYHYRTSLEAEFLRIERWHKINGGVCHWRVRTPQNTQRVFGQEKNARIAVPGKESKIYRWLLECEVDARGNEIVYDYLVDNPSGTGNSCTVQRPLSQVRYGRHSGPDGGERWHFKIVFDYADTDPATFHVASSAPAGDLHERTDQFSNFRPGFELCTQRVCSNILLFHHFDSKKPHLVQNVHLGYDRDPRHWKLTHVTHTRFSRVGRKAQKISLPTLTITYAPPDTDTGFKNILVHNPKGGHSGFKQAVLHFMDLEETGVTGVIQESGSGLWFSRALGNGEFAPAELVKHYPNRGAVKSGKFHLSDITGDGRLDIVSMQSEAAGFFENLGNGEWAGFQPFNGVPLEIGHNGGFHVDATGDGRKDYLVLQPNRTLLYRSLGAKGYSTPAIWDHDLDLPDHNMGRSTEFVGFARMFGDGTSHLIRIREDVVSVWPHLGHGRFERRRVIKPPSEFKGDFDPSRLRLVDTDGSGFDDIVYISGDHVDIFRNQAGKGFSEAQRIELPHQFDDLDQIDFADILGNGRMCLVFSSRGSELQSKHQFVDFSAGREGDIPTELDNGMGWSATITYGSSTQFYLDAQREGKPWRHHPPFAVPVVKSLTVNEQITNQTHCTSFRYSNGFYDRAKKAFRGFGYVEQHEHEIQPERDESNQKCEMAAAALSRTWFYSGALPPSVQGNVVKNTTQDPADTAPDAGFVGEKKLPELPRSFVETDDASIYGALDEGACRALSGHLARHEVYSAAAWFAPQADAKPYIVSQTNYRVRLVQDETDRVSAVYAVFPSEKLTLNLEQSYGQPRIDHSIVVEIDALGHVTKDCHLGYPSPEERSRSTDDVSALASVVKLVPPILPGADYLSGLHAAEAQFELQFQYPGPSYLIFHKSVLEMMTELPATVQADDVLGAARRLSASRHYFWNSSFDQALSPLGDQADDMAPQGLVHHSERAVFSDADVDKTYAKNPLLNIFDNASSDSAHARLKDWLSGQGKFIHKEGHWWDRGTVTHYKTAQGTYYLPNRLVDCFGGKTDLGYDEWNLMLTSFSDAAKHVSRVSYDFYHLKPESVTDMNGLTTWTVFDALGDEMATSVEGRKDGIVKGDGSLQGYKIPEKLSIQSLLKTPEKFLDGVASIKISDHGCWADGKTPPHTVVARRTRTGGGKAKPDEILLEVSYFDGFNREVQNKLRCASGLAISRNTNGTLEKADNGKLKFRPSNSWRWHGTGWSLYSTKGQVICQYDPFYSTSSGYEDDGELKQLGDVSVLQYDPICRVIRTDTSDGFHTTHRYHPWMDIFCDEIDTLAQSVALTALSNRPDANLLRQLAKGAPTPKIHHLDRFGRVDGVSYDLGGGNLQSTRLQLSVLGQIEKVTDARGVLSETNLHDMTGELIEHCSADAGDRLFLHDARGLKCEIYGSRNIRVRNTYDLMHRLTEVRVEAREPGGLNFDERLTEQIFYGSKSKADKDKNRCGRLIRKIDQAGEVAHTGYAQHGSVLSWARRVWKDPEATPVLEPGITAAKLVPVSETMSFSQELDALGRTCKYYHPDETAIVRHHLSEGWLREIAVQPKGFTEPQIVGQLTYDTHGHMTSAHMGNGTVSEFSHDPVTHHIVSAKISYTPRPDPATPAQGGMLQKRPTEHAHIFQHVNYAYDPIGRIAEVIDNLGNAPGRGKSREVYIYDALSQLSTVKHESSVDAQLAQRDSPTGPSSGHPKVETSTVAFGYDPSGNKIRRDHKKGPPDASLQIESGSNRLMADGFSYDGHGNIRRMPDGTEFVWDHHDRLHQITLKHDEAGESARYRIQYFYDASGQRVHERVERAFEVASSYQIITERLYADDYRSERQYLDGQPGPKQEQISIRDDYDCVALLDPVAYLRNPNFLQYLYTDHIGSITLELDGYRRSPHWFDYAPYGAVKEVTADPQTPTPDPELGFGGQPYDPLTRLSYYGARFYSSSLERWINPDPMGSVDGENLYRFAGNDPVNHVDVGGFGKTEKTHKHLGKYKTKPYDKPKPKPNDKSRYKNNDLTRKDFQPGTKSAAIDNHNVRYSTNIPHGIKKDAPEVNASINHRMSHDDIKSSVVKFMNWQENEMDLMRWTGRFETAASEYTSKLSEMREVASKVSKERIDRVAARLKKTNENMKSTRENLVNAVDKMRNSKMVKSEAVSEAGQQHLEALNNHLMNVATLGTHLDSNRQVSSNAHLNTEKGAGGRRLSIMSNQVRRMSISRIHPIALGPKGENLAELSGLLVPLQPEWLQRDGSGSGVHPTANVEVAAHPVIDGITPNHRKLFSKKEKKLKID